MALTFPQLPTGWEWRVYRGCEGDFNPFTAYVEIRRDTFWGRLNWISIKQGVDFEGYGGDEIDRNINELAVEVWDAFQARQRVPNKLALLDEHIEAWNLKLRSESHS